MTKRKRKVSALCLFLSQSPAKKKKKKRFPSLPLAQVPAEILHYFTMHSSLQRLSTLLYHLVPLMTLRTFQSLSSLALHSIGGIRR